MANTLSYIHPSSIDRLPARKESPTAQAIARLHALRLLSSEERDRILQETSEQFAEEYQADSQKPLEEREFTAFLRLDDVDPIHDPENPPCP